ncbi:MAG: Na/Pi cotransporter family protein [Ruminococcaceae bacterium]|nr:Na/Pi cotransporter family protein [Oscillospiraceae bacterium]
MNFFDVLSLLGGVSLFLFGMDQMGSALERRAGAGLKTMLGRLTSGKAAGFLTGLAVTAVIQSSSATTVMVVGFVNSGLMSLRQAINVIMGANVGTTVTAWIFSLTGLESESIWVQLLKPASFTPILALVGVICLMRGRQGRRRDTGVILLGFAVLMTGMEMMSAAVAPLREVPQFGRVLLLFTNPILGVLAGAVLTAVLQSSSAAVGVLQALTVTGQVTYGAAIPLIMGQNIGTCVTAMLSSVGTGRNARRAALVHLSFNVLGSAVWLVIFQLVRTFLALPFLDRGIDRLGIAAVHSVFNILCTLLLLPAAGALEKLVCRLIPEPECAEQPEELDERLMATPALAVQRCRDVTERMAALADGAVRDALAELTEHDASRAARIRAAEADADRYEDLLGTYLVRLSALPLSEEDTVEVSELLHMIGDLERISDHAVHLLDAACEISEKKITFTPAARAELQTLRAAVAEAVELAVRAFTAGDLSAAAQVEPLEQVVDELKKKLRARHILRLQRGECSIEAGFIWSDLLTDLERVAAHCSSIAACLLEMRYERLDLHGYLRAVRRGSADYAASYADYRCKYKLEQDIE